MENLQFYKIILNNYMATTLHKNALRMLKEKVFQANLDLVKNWLVLFTWGNVSGIDRENEIVVIKPSWVNYETMKVDDMVVVDLKTGKKIEGNLNPSSDTPTHLVIYPGGAPIDWQ